MIRQICKDVIFLAQPSQPAMADDAEVARDLAETLAAHRETCVGMAANMIGKSKRIIAFMDGGEPVTMLNPEIIKKEEPYTTEEGCLSLTGTREAKRFRTIKVKWQTEAMQTRMKTYKGFTAQIIQHEIDHCNGIII